MVLSTRASILSTARIIGVCILEQVEPPLLAAVMNRCGQRCAPAARVLGLHRTTLKKKLNQYEIEEAGNEA